MADRFHLTHTLLDDQCSDSSLHFLDPIKPSKPNRALDVSHVLLHLLAFLPVAVFPMPLLTVLVAVTVGAAATAVLAPLSSKSSSTPAA